MPVDFVTFIIIKKRMRLPLCRSVFLYAIVSVFSILAEAEDATDLSFKDFMRRGLTPKGDVSKLSNYQRYTLYQSQQLSAEFGGDLGSCLRRHESVLEREKREFAEQLRKSQPQQKPSPISKPSNTKSSNRPSNTAFDPKLPRVQTPTRDLRSSRGHVASDASDHLVQKNKYQTKRKQTKAFSKLVVREDDEQALTSSSNVQSFLTLNQPLVLSLRSPSPSFVESVV